MTVQSELPRRSEPTYLLTRELVHVAIRLHRRFGREASLSQILTLVGACWRDLDIATSGGLPELVERLATQRLIDASGPDSFFLRDSANHV